MALLREAKLALHRLWKILWTFEDSVYDPIDYLLWKGLRFEPCQLLLLFQWTYEWMGQWEYFIFEKREKWMRECFCNPSECLNLVKYLNVLFMQCKWKTWSIDTMLRTAWKHFRAEALPREGSPTRCVSPLLHHQYVSWVLLFCWFTEPLFLPMLRFLRSYYMSSVSSELVMGRNNIFECAT